MFAEQINESGMCSRKMQDQRVAQSVSKNIEFSYYSDLSFQEIVPLSISIHVKIGIGTLISFLAIIDDERLKITRTNIWDAYTYLHIYIYIHIVYIFVSCRYYFGKCSEL